MTDQGDGRSPFALAMEWTSRITTISLELVVPVGIGYWLDQRWGTRPFLLVAGTILGFATALLSLLQLAKPTRRDRPPD